MSSDSSDEDNTKFRDSIDVTLFNNDMFTGNKKETEVKIKSNRHISSDSCVNDIKVSASVQKTIGDKLSKLIENKVVFVDKKIKYPKKKSDPDVGIKLFSDSENFINPDESPYDNYVQGPQKKIKKRKIEDDIDCLNKNEKIKACAVTPEFVMSKEEIKLWKSRRKEKLFQYKKKKNSNVCTLK